jgi:hypothetical protein
VGAMIIGTAATLFILLSALERMTNEQSAKNTHRTR